MPRNDSTDLQPPIKYKTWRAARPLTTGEIKAAADRAEARAMRTKMTDDLPSSGASTIPPTLLARADKVIE
jgi:hypothetical protein